MKKLLVDYSKCTGCGSCEMHCSSRSGEFNPLLSFINVVRREKEGAFIPLVCAHCEEPVCQAVCPYGAISRVDGIVRVEQQKCRGCRLCLQVCPFGALRQLPGQKTVQKCDLCGGDPQCARYCPSGSLQYVEEEVYNRSRRRELAARVWDEATSERST
ncbi:Anaerobic dimethyl sulfoxide reductase chain B [Neomoorella glycerini]|uniref:Anaerobic dimethyl sulfoxide reductase chain B n=1 Tax=Neomoorella glycerini TaxID=55779 RepID=A0A6I5ZTN9_9FIRM|nr:4Fe-4S dicluster domain-containing protein [Moorella glycerini]QGP93116.1 Anaerobic dimethyl sulfoxide reductase chain B [Moorella glycerini]